MEYKKISNALDVLYWVIKLTEKGDRNGWGYDILSLNRAYSAISNELVMKINENNEEEKDGLLKATGAKEQKTDKV